MRATRVDPRRAGVVEIRTAFPDGTSHGQLGHVFRRRDAIHFVDEQTETVAEIHHRGVERRARWCVEHQARRIRFAADAERMHFERHVAVGDGRTDFQHVRPEHHLVAVLQMISVILHEGRAAETGGHDFHRTNERRCLPIAFARETKTRRHHALRTDTR